MAKQKNPLDLLLETNFILYDFKAFIVNASNKLDAMNFLQENFDEKGFLFFLRFSFWKIEYEKYLGEGEKLYMTNNLDGGFVQRLEHFINTVLGYGEYMVPNQIQKLGVLLK